MKKKRFALPFLVIIIGVGIMLMLTMHTSQKYGNARMTSFEEFEQHKENHEILRVECDVYEDYMYYVLKTEYTERMDAQGIDLFQPAQYYKTYFPMYNEQYTKELLESGIAVKKISMTVNGVVEKYSSLFMLALLGLFMFFTYRRAMPANGEAVMEVAADALDVSFDDIIGLEEVKDDLKLLIKQMKSKNKAFQDLTHGILFEGPPGTGKTMLAKAVAKAAGFNFISVNSSSLVQIYVGVGAKRIREVFKKARKTSPCIIFFDEIDAIGTNRGQSKNTSEHEQTINALLAEMDGFKDRGDIVVIAATNRADDLDEALVRAGRFDKKIRIMPPHSWEERKELFDHYIKETKLDESVNTENLAKQTIGYTGSDIAAICREAKMIMYSNDREIMQQEDLEEAIDKILFHGNRSKDEQEESLGIVAYHEAGHAIMTMLCNKPVARISIMGMTSGVGGAVFSEDENKVFTTKQDAVNQVMIAYAGRASEEIKFGKDQITNGASNDISQATKVLVNYITKYGFDDSLLDYSVFAEVGISVDDLTKRLSELSTELYEQTVSRLLKHYDMVEELAVKLLDVKTMSGDEIKVMFPDGISKDIA